MEKESVVKFYKGNKLVGSEYPFMLVVGDTTYQNYPCGEYFVFTGIPKHELICRRVNYLPEGSEPQSFEWDTFPEIFSAKAIMESEFRFARDAFENAILETDRNLHSEVFWNGRNFEFNEVKNYQDLIRWKIVGKFQHQLPILAKSRNGRVREISRRLDELPKVKFLADINKLEL